MRPSVLKNIRRDKHLEALYYYHLILRYATKFLRLKHGWHDKVEFDLKHIYRDLPEIQVKHLEEFYSVKPSDIEENMPKLKSWLFSL